MNARYPGVCAACGDPIDVGDPIRGLPGRRGWAHTRCPAPLAAWPPLRLDAEDAWAAIDREQALRERERDEAEYQAGIEDARRWHENKQLFGDAYADAFENERDLRGLNGEW